MVASPSNPTGTMVTAEETRICEVVRRRAASSSSTDLPRLTYGLDAPTAAAPARTSSRQQLLQVFPDDGRGGSGGRGTPRLRARDRELRKTSSSRLAVAQHAALACFEPATIAIVEARRAELTRRPYLSPRWNTRHQGAVCRGRLLHLRDVSASRRQLRLRARPPHAKRVSRSRRQGLRPQRARSATSASPTRRRSRARGGNRSASPIHRESKRQ